MKVKMLITREGPRRLQAGEIYDLDEAEAKRLIDRQKAEPVEKRKSPAKSAPAKKPETAMKKPSPAKE